MSSCPFLSGFSLNHYSLGIIPQIPYSSSSSAKTSPNPVEFDEWSIQSYAMTINANDSSVAFSYLPYFLPSFLKPENWMIWEQEHLFGVPGYYQALQPTVPAAFIWQSKSLALFNSSSAPKFYIISSSEFSIQSLSPSTFIYLFEFVYAL